MKHYLILTVLAFVVLSVSMFASVSAQDPTPDVAAIQTMVAGQVYATLTAIASTPVITATPTITATRAPLLRVSGGLGVTLSDVRKSFEAEGFEFVPGESLKDGTPSVYANRQGLVMILYGSPERLKEVAVRMDYASAATDANSSKQVSALFLLIDLLAPGNSDIPFWVGSNMNRAVADPIVKVFGDIRAGVGTVDNGKALMLLFDNPADDPTPTPVAQVTPVLQDQQVKLLDKWDVALISTRRDKTIWGVSGAETAFGVWASFIFKVRNLQSGSDYMGKQFNYQARVDGNLIEYRIMNTVESKAQWFYSCCQSSYALVQPGQEQVILITFDLPESTTNVQFNFSIGKTPIAPNFWVPNFDQIPARKMK